MRIVTGCPKKGSSRDAGSSAKAVKVILTRNFLQKVHGACILLPLQDVRGGKDDTDT